MSRDRIPGPWVEPLLLISAMVAVSVRLGPDASFDLRNYHLYAGFAGLRKPPFLDLVPAQRQSFHPPLVDIAGYWLRTRLDRWPRLLDSLFAVPSGIAAVLAWAIGRRVLPEYVWTDRIFLLLAVLFGATGAAGLPTTGTSMSEMPAGCLALAGLLLLLRREGPSPLLETILAGVLFGAAVGVKLTLAPMAGAAMVAGVVRDAGGARRRALVVVWLGSGIVLGMLLTGGFWWWHLQRLTGSPVFPYLNALFRSPLVAPIDLVDTRFLPRSVSQALFYPLTWAVTPSRNVSEMPLRDPRLALVCMLVPVWLLLTQLRGRRAAVNRTATTLLVFCAACFVLWEIEFSILRYLAPVELLSGLLLLPVLRPLRRHSIVLPPAIVAALLLGSAALTIYPDWGRLGRSGRAVDVELPALPPDAMVLLLDRRPMAYLAASAPVSVRFVGLDNNLVHPGQDSLLERRIAQAVSLHPGPLYGLEPAILDPQATAALGFHGLHRLACRPVHSNLDNNALRLCRLGR